MKFSTLFFVIFLATNITTFAALPPQQQERTFTEMFDSVFSDCLNQDFQD